MNLRVRIEPEPRWPAHLTLRRGLAIAHARPWNAEHHAASLRLRRGGSRFLRSCVDALMQLGAPATYSPPLPADAASVWERAGFQPSLELALLRLELGRFAEAVPEVTAGADISDIVAIDRAAFDSFWSLDEDGLREAMGATRRAVVLTIGEPIAGFAIVGLGVVAGYLQRIAVLPDHQGRGLGTSLVHAAAATAQRAGNRHLFLNTQTDNDASLRLYQRFGFERMKQGLLLMRA